MPRRKREIRSKQKTRPSRQRLLILLLIVLGVGLLATALIYPSLRPVTDIATAEPISRPNPQANSIGNPDAPVKVEVYSDFQCPGCAYYSKTFEPELIRNYIDPGKVYLTFRSWAFIDDNATVKESRKAAEAAYCAMDQNRFWEYHDILFANQTGENIGNFTNRRLIAFADTLKLDVAPFKQCLNGGKYANRVQDERLTGNRLGIRGTPAFVVNGMLVNIQKSYLELTDAVDAELAKIEQ